MHQERPEEIACRYKLKGSWKEISRKELYRSIERSAHSLQALGLKKGDRILICSPSRFEWTVIDFAALCLGMVVVPLYVNSTKEDIQFIFDDSEPSAIFVDGEESWNHLNQSLASTNYKVPSVVVSFETISTKDFSGLSWPRFLKQAANLPKTSTPFEEECKRVELSDLATLIYTSGTTGVPKAAAISHVQLSSQIREVVNHVGLGPSDSSLTFLPFAHVLGRIESWGLAVAGYTVNFAESPERVSSNLREVSPTFIIGVPRIFEKIYLGIQTELEHLPLKSKIFKEALSIGKKISIYKRFNRLPSIQDSLAYWLAKSVVFERVHARMGGRLRFAFSGGSPLDKKISEFFHALDVLILEGYGLTETTGAVCANSPESYELGTVGTPIGDVEIKLSDENEILVRSDKVMLGYWKKGIIDRTAFVGEFFPTGDIGSWSSHGFLKITDRKKDLIKTAGGKYVAPQKIENLLRQNPIIANAYVHGDRRKYVVALLTLNPTEKSRPQEDLDREVRNFISYVNSQLASFETIKNFMILPNDFNVQSGEMTPSLKIRRRTIEKIFAKEIDSLYGDLTTN